MIFLNRIKLQNGSSGVLIALFLVTIGVGLVAGIDVFLGDSENQVIRDANNTLLSVGMGS